MKLVRQVRLHFQEGRSDKIYEVDLCEVGADRYVVNFRYGRRGSALKDGSKTPLPVSLADAERIYDKLVQSKTAKGYAETTAGPAPPAAAPPPVVPVEALPDPRHQHALRALADPSTAWSPDRDRVIYRVGELRIREAAPLLLALLDQPPPKVDPKRGGKPGLRTWNLVRALVRVGDRAARPALARVAGDASQPDHIRFLAACGELTLSSPDERAALATRHCERLPPWLTGGLQRGEIEAVAADLGDQPDLLRWLYLTSVAPFGEEPAHDPLREGLLGLLRLLPLRPPHFQHLRALFKAAEALGDAEVFGILARRFELEPPMYRRSWGRYVYVKDLGRVVVGDPRIAWSGGTRTWFRRRIWRTLRRLGEAGAAAEYCALAAGVLLALEEGDGREPRRTEYWGWSGSAVVHHYGPHSHLWAASHLLHRSAAHFEPVGRSLNVRSAGGPATPATGREEAFPELWDQQPEQLIAMLMRARYAPVARFAAHAFRANPSHWPRLSTRDLLALFVSAHAEVVALAADIAVGRYDPKNPDPELVLALVGCPHEGARQAAIGWVRDNPTPFVRDLDFLRGLVLHPVAVARQLALDVLAATTLPSDVAKALVDEVLAAARRATADDPDAPAVFRDAAVVLVASFAAELRGLPLDLVAELVAHPVEGVSEIGAKILLNHEIRPVDLPDDLLAAVMTAPHPVVRGIGIRLYGELPDATLAERTRVLLDLITNRHPDVRAAVRPIVGRLARDNPGFARTLLRALVPAVAGDGPEGMHADVVRLLRHELGHALEQADGQVVFALIEAKEGVVQQLGGELLRNQIDPAELTVEQVARLGRSDILAIRQAAWRLLEASVERAREQADALLPLFDAPWDDSRQMAFHYLDQRVGPEHVSPQLAIAICDSPRPDVQAFGRRLVTRRFEGDDGASYLLALAQHPSPAMQLFASTWLEGWAAGAPDRVERLEPFFLGVLLRPNVGAVAKQRVLAFLRGQAAADAVSAGVAARVMTALSASSARTYRAAAIEALLDIATHHPDLAVPLTVHEPEVRRAL